MSLKMPLYRTESALEEYGHLRLKFTATQRTSTTVYTARISLESTVLCVSFLPMNEVDFKSAKPLEPSGWRGQLV